MHELAGWVRWRSRVQARHVGYKHLHRARGIRRTSYYTQHKAYLKAHAAGGVADAMYMIHSLHLLVFVNTSFCGFAYRACWFELLREVYQYVVTREDRASAKAVTQ